MASINLGAHFEAFVERQISGGRFQNASEVIRAGLRLLEDREEDRALHANLMAEINAAWDDPSPSIPADDVFERLDSLHAQTMSAKRGLG